MYARAHAHAHTRVGTSLVEGPLPDRSALAAYYFFLTMGKKERTKHYKWGHMSNRKVCLLEERKKERKKKRKKEKRKEGRKKIMFIIFFNHMNSYRSISWRLTIL